MRSVFLLCEPQRWLPAQCTIGTNCDRLSGHRWHALRLYAMYARTHPPSDTRTAPQTASAMATGTMYHRSELRASAGTDGMCCGSIPCMHSIRAHRWRKNALLLLFFCKYQKKVVSLHPKMRAMRKKRQQMHTGTASGAADGENKKSKQSAFCYCFCCYFVTLRHFAFV